MVKEKKKHCTTLSSRQKKKKKEKTIIGRYQSIRCRDVFSGWVDLAYDTELR